MHKSTINAQISHLHRGIDILQKLEDLLGKEGRRTLNNFEDTMKRQNLLKELEEEFDATVTDAKEARALRKTYLTEIASLKEKREDRKGTKNCYRRRSARY